MQRYKVFSDCAVFFSLISTWFALLMELAMAVLTYLS